jgi:hypothetical protein
MKGDKDMKLTEDQRIARTGWDQLTLAARRVLENAGVEK